MKFFFPGKQEGAIPPKVDRKPNRRRLPRRARVTVWLSLLALLLVSIGPMTDHISVMYEELSLYMDAALDTGQLRYETARSKNSEEQQLDESIRLTHTSALGAVLDFWVDPQTPPTTKELVDIASSTEQVWLLDADGNVTVGEAMPSDVTLAQRQTLAQSETVVHTSKGSYYSAACQFGSVVLGFSNTGDAGLGLAESINWRSVMGDITINQSGFVFVVDTNGRYQGFDDSSMDGRSASRLLSIESGSSELVLLGQEFYLVRVRDMEDGGRVVAAMYLMDVVIRMVNAVKLSLLALVVAMLAVLLYALILLTDRTTVRTPHLFVKLPAGFSLDMTLAPRITALSLGVLLLLGGSMTYIQTLNSISQQNLKAENGLKSVELQLGENQSQSDTVTEKFYSIGYTDGDMLAAALALQPALLEGDRLEALAERLHCLAIDIFDGDGTAVASSTPYRDYTLQDDPDDPSSAACLDVMSGSKVHLATEVDDNSCYIVVRRQDGVGIVRLTFPLQMLQERRSRLSLDATLLQADLGGGSALAFDVETGILLSDDVLGWKGLSGASPLDLGLSEGCLRDGYAGSQTLLAEKVYMNVKRSDSMWLVSVIPMESVINAGAAQVRRMLFSAVLLFLLMLMACTLHRGPRTTVPLSQALRAPRIRFDTATTTANGHRVNGPVMGRKTSDGNIRWEDRTPEDKYATAVGALFIGTVLLSALLVLSAGSQGDSLMAYLLSGQWERSFNIFAVTTGLLLFIVVFSFSWVVRKVVFMVGRNLGSRSETLARQLCSAIKYISFIITVFYALSLMGVKASTLVASAGFLSAMLVFGAQNLTADILAGVFLVFEGDFRVGDMVSVDGWRGVVLEIGLRTTKVENLAGDIQIINNSQIKKLINMTQEYSTVSCTFTLDAAEDLSRVEQLLQAEFPVIRKAHPEIVSGPYYCDVVELSGAGTVLRVDALCREEDRIRLQREMLRDIKLLCDREGVAIPKNGPPPRPTQEKSGPAANAAGPQLVKMHLQGGGALRMSTQNDAVLPLRLGFLPGPAEKLLQSLGEFHGHLGPIGEEEFRKAMFLAVLCPVVGIPKSRPWIGIFTVRIHSVGVEPRDIVRILRRFLREGIAHLAGNIRHISRAYQILRGHPQGADMGQPAVRRKADQLVHSQIPVLCLSQSRVSGEEFLSRKAPDRVSLNGYALSRRIAVRRVVKGHHQDLVLFLIPRHQITVPGDLHQRIDFLLPGHNGVLNRLLVQGLHRGGSLPRHRMRNRCGCAADTDSGQQRKNNGGTVCFVHGVLPAFPFESIVAKPRR